MYMLLCECLMGLHSCLCNVVRCMSVLACCIALILMVSEKF
jgi:hypothetical protein